MPAALQSASPLWRGGYRRREPDLLLSRRCAPAVAGSSSPFGGRRTILHCPSPDRQRLQDDVEPVADLVRERRADGEPEVILAFALDDGVGAIVRVAGWPSLASFRFRLGSVLVGAHDGEHARRLLRVGGIFRTAVHVEGVVVDLEEVGFARRSRSCRSRARGAGRCPR